MPILYSRIIINDIDYEIKLKLLKLKTNLLKSVHNNNHYEFAKSRRYP
jgi:hypothetical protein